MPVLQFIWDRITALLSTALLLLTLAALFAIYRYTAFHQEDDAERLRGKRDYLEQLSGLPSSGRAPNIIFILYDDLGYGDVGLGAGDKPPIKTPNIDRLAANGVMLSDFHSPAPVCTPARAGYLTGRLPLRAGLPNVVFPSHDNWKGVMARLGDPDSNQRLPAEEITLADILKARGYATGMVGKWHMGDVSPSLPNDFGFDYYYGALYSNDMTPFAHYRNRDIAVPAPVDQRRMSEYYTREAVDFVRGHANRAFFLYFAHNFPHDPLSVREERAGRSEAGLFGDVMEEIDDGVGELVAALADTGTLDNTLIVITSDNGPWFLGSGGGQRGRKGSTFEGGMRVPFIAHWPASIPAGRVEPAMAMGTDLVPTVLDILGLPAPGDRVLDGRSILPVLTAGSPTPHDYLYYFDGESLFAVRSQRFKYRGAASVHYGTDQMPVAFGIPQKEWLFDLAGDTREAYDTSLRHPETLEELRRVFEDKESEMADNLRGWRGEPR